MYKNNHIIVNLQKLKLPKLTLLW